MSKKGVLLAFEEANAARQPGELPFEVVEKPTRRNGAAPRTSRLNLPTPSAGVQSHD